MSECKYCDNEVPDEYGLNVCDECEERMSLPASCSHDYENCVRKGRARYHCPKCDADITLDVILIAEAKMEEF